MLDLRHVAVVPAGGWGSRWSVLLAYLPHILTGLAIIATIVIVSRWVRWWRLLRYMGYAFVALLLTVPVAHWLTSRSSDHSNKSKRPVDGSSTAAWPTFMGGPQRVGVIDGQPGPAAAFKRWAIRDGVSPFAGSAAVLGDRVYVGSDNRKLYCLDVDDGRILWTFTAAAELFGAPVVADGRVYFGEGLHETCDARVYCLSADDGRKLWEFATASHVEFSPTLRDGRLFVAAGEDGVYCLDASTGAKLWHYPSVHVDMCPAATEDGVFFGNAYGPPHFYRLDGRTGQLIWKTSAPLEVRGSPSTDGRRVLFSLGNGTFVMSHASPLGGVACVDVADGRLLWQTDFVADAVLTAVGLADGRGFFGSRDGHVYSIDLETGRKLWQFAADEAVVSSPAVSAGRVYFGCDSGVIFCLESTSGDLLWSYDSGQLAFNESRIVGSPVLSGKRLFVGSTNFYFMCLEEQRP